MFSGPVDHGRLYSAGAFVLHLILPIFRVYLLEIFSGLVGSREIYSTRAFLLDLIFRIFWIYLFNIFMDSWIVGIFISLELSYGPCFRISFRDVFWGCLLDKFSEPVDHGGLCSTGAFVLDLVFEISLDFTFWTHSLGL